MHSGITRVETSFDVFGGLGKRISDHKISYPEPMVSTGEKRVHGPRGTWALGKKLVFPLRGEGAE